MAFLQSNTPPYRASLVDMTATFKAWMWWCNNYFPSRCKPDCH